MPTYNMTCCVCGGGAGSFNQHWNRDDGYGICCRCVAEEAVRLTADELRQNYGLPEVNYDQPVVRHLGRKYRVLGTTKQLAEANAFMERRPDAAVLTVFDDGTIVIADKNDLGIPLEPS